MEIIIFPNPSADGVFNISQSANWKVTSVLGEELKSVNSNQKNLSKHPKGIYLTNLKARSKGLFWNNNSKYFKNMFTIQVLDVSYTKSKDQFIISKSIL